jgi:hypothetical protein
MTQSDNGPTHTLLNDGLGSVRHIITNTKGGGRQSSRLGQATRQFSRESSEIRLKCFVLAVTKGRW